MLEPELHGVTPLLDSPVTQPPPVRLLGSSRGGVVALLTLLTLTCYINRISLSVAITVVLLPHTVGDEHIHEADEYARIFRAQQHASLPSWICYHKAQARAQACKEYFLMFIYNT